MAVKIGSPRFRNPRPASLVSGSAQVAALRQKQVSKPGLPCAAASKGFTSKALSDSVVLVERATRPNAYTRRPTILRSVAAAAGIIVLYLVLQFTALILHVIGASESHTSSVPIGTRHINTNLLMRLGTDLNFIAWGVLLVGVIRIVVSLRKRSSSRAPAFRVPW